MVTTAPRTEVMRHSSKFGEWEMVTRDPAAHLRAYVTKYEGYVVMNTTFARRLEIPSSDVVLIINFGPKYRVSGPGNAAGASEHHSFTAGLIDSYVIVEATGLSSGIQVNFTPIGAHLFLDMPMSEVTNRTVDFDDVLGGAARRIVAQLEDTPDWEARFDILDAFIAARVTRAAEPSPGVAWAWRRLHETDGQLGIGALADEIGWSRKHLITRFREQIGLPPKTMARIVRFGRVIRQLDGVAEVRWAQIAAGCGYYDQAHFNRDFREFTGGTPTEFLLRRIPDGGGLLG